MRDFYRSPDEAFIDRLLSAWRAYVVFQSNAAHDALCELLHERQADLDPDWKRPEIMGKGPSVKCREFMAEVCE